MCYCACLHYLYRLYVYSKRYGTAYLFAPRVSDSYLDRKRKVYGGYFYSSKYCRQSRRYAYAVRQSAKFVSILQFEIPTFEFVQIMFPPFVLSIILITACCFIIKPEKLEFSGESYVLNRKSTVFYLLLFALSIVIVFRVIPYWIGLIIIPIALLFTDRKALLQVDYGLLGTFAAFFVFAGNMARIDAVRNFFSTLLEKSTLVFSIL